jgi:hypothetical protein
MFAEIIYKNHNQEIKAMPVKDYNSFAIFVKTNIRDIVWARYYCNNILIDEYNNLSHFNFNHIEVHFPRRLANNSYTLISKWNIEKFKDFVKKHFPNQIGNFWTHPDQFMLSDIDSSIVDKSGKIIATTLKDFNDVKPTLPKDVLIVRSTYLEKEFNKIKELTDKMSQQQRNELIEMDQFTMLHIGI